MVEQVRAAAATGQLAVGDPLPSVRVLAAQLVVNPNTVAKAYAELCRSGVTVAERGRGVFIAERRQTLSHVERKRRLTACADAYVREATLLGYSQAEGLEVMERRWSAIPGRKKKS